CRSGGGRGTGAAGIGGAFPDPARPARSMTRGQRCLFEPAFSLARDDCGVAPVLSETAARPVSRENRAIGVRQRSWARGRFVSPLSFVSRAVGENEFPPAGAQVVDILAFVAVAVGKKIHAPSVQQAVTVVAFKPAGRHAPNEPLQCPMPVCEAIVAF